MKRGMLIVSLSAAFALCSALPGCGEEEEVKKGPGAKAVEDAANDLAQNKATSGWQWLWRPITVSAQGIADAWRRDYTVSDVNPADGMRGGPTYETLPAIVMHLQPNAGDVNNGKASMLVTNTSTKCIERVEVSYAIDTPAESPTDKVTIRVTEGINSRGVDLKGRFYKGVQVSEPCTQAQAAALTEYLRSKYNVSVEKKTETASDKKAG